MPCSLLQDRATLGIGAVPVLVSFASGKFHLSVATLKTKLLTLGTLEGMRKLQHACCELLGFGNLLYVKFGQNYWFCRSKLLSLLGQQWTQPKVYSFSAFLFSICFLVTKFWAVRGSAESTALIIWFRRTDSTDSSAPLPSPSVFFPLPTHTSESWSVVGHL